MIEIVVDSAEYDRIDEALNTPLVTAFMGTDSTREVVPGRAVIPLDQPPRGSMQSPLIRPRPSLTIREADQEWPGSCRVRAGRSVVVRVIGWADGEVTVERET